MDEAFKVLAPAETLKIVMRLLAEIALSEPGDTLGEATTNKSPSLLITAEGHKSWVLVRLQPSLKSAAARGALPPELELPFELARKLVSNRLYGQLKRSELDGRIDLKLPIGSGALDETVVL